MPKITLYSTPNCSKCMLVKSMFEDKLSYRSINDSDRVTAKAQELGLMAMPILVVDGNPYSGKGAVIKAKEILQGA